MAGELKIVGTEKKAAESSTLKSEVSYDAQNESMNNLTFLLGPHMDKFHANIMAEVDSLLGEYVMTVLPTSHHTQKVASHTDDD